MMVAGVGTLTNAPSLPVGSTAGCSTVSTSATNMAATPNNMPSSPTDNNNSDTGPTRPRSSENRRSNKPIMEKRRRARINNCLNELKTLILDAMKKDPARHSKLEKADILEMTVKHLETLQRQQVAMVAATDPTVANKFRAGFTECAGEVGRFPGLDGPVKRRLLQHLSNCLNNTSPQSTTTPQPSQTVTTATNETTTVAPPVQVHILRTPDSNIIQGLQLVPTRLPNGDIALILPAARTALAPAPTSPSPSVSSASSATSPLPMLIPIPNRTTTPSSPSPVAFDRLSVNSPTRQVTLITQQLPPAHQPSPPPPQQQIREEADDRLVIAEDYEVEQSQHHYQEEHHYPQDRETLLHIPEMPERDYYEDSYDAECEYYPPACSYSPEPLALVTRKRCEVDEDQPWRPW